MRFLLIILFLFFGCDDSNPSGSSLDLCGVVGGDDINEDGYHCGDLEVLQEIIDINPAMGGMDILSDIPFTPGWDSNGRLIYFGPGDDIESGLINYLPESFGELTSLVNIDIFYEPIVNLPQSIGNLINLTSFEIYETQITSLPDSFSELINLDYTPLTHNLLSSLPENLCDNLSLSANIEVYGNQLCNEYNPQYNQIFWCIEILDFNDAGENPQDYTNCCEGVNNSGETMTNWTNCP